MTANERTMQSIEKEIAKLAASLERYEKALEKKVAKCEKLGCNWSLEEHRAILKEFYARHEGEQVIPYGNDDDLLTEKQESAWFDMYCAQGNVEDAKSRLENAEKRYNKISGIVEEENAKNEAFMIEYNRLSDMERKWLAEKKEQEYLAWVKEFVADCAKDGIKIDTEKYFMPTYSQVYGLTPKGKRFALYLNSGWTERSFHCYTLRIDGKTVFTSGLFWRSYNVIKNS